MAEYLSRGAFREKLLRSIDKYLALSENNSLTIGLVKGEKMYIFGKENAERLMYDIGSITKTVTAHIVLSLADEGKINIQDSIDRYLDLPEGKYPTVYALLTHTAGYGNLTPWEITIPALIRHGYARANIYERCDSRRLMRSIKRRKKYRESGYGYSDFAYAILALICEVVTGVCFADLIEDFVQNRLGMTETVVIADEKSREPKAALGRRTIDYWRWERENPYIGGGGLVSTVSDMMKYLLIQTRSKEKFITDAHAVCEKSRSDRSNIMTCIGWHTYKKSNQLWHVGGVGTFRSSVIFNRKCGIGVVALGNAKGVASANVHYIAKMLYSEMKIRKIKLN